MSGLEIILGIVGVSLAVPPTLEVITRVGTKIENKVAAYKDVDDAMRRFRMVGTTMATGLLSKQLSIIGEAVRNTQQDPDFITALDAIFREIVRDIIKSDDLFEKLYPRGVRQKLKYAWVSKSSLVSALDGFSRNQATFLAMAQYVQIEREKPSPFKLGPTDLIVHHETAGHIPGQFLLDSSIFVSQGSYSVGQADLREEGDIVVEVRRTNSTDDVKAIDLILRDLKSSNQGDGILPCLGYRVTDRLRDGCTLFFRVPIPGEKQSLLHYLQASPQLPLNQRIKLCCQLAQSISTLHSIGKHGFVHKNIRPTNILLVGDDTEKGLFLTDWTQLRVAENFSTRVTTKDWDVSFYQHPERRADFVVHDYTIVHDIYSLGVCMLEILFGKPFISFSADDGLPLLSTEFRKSAINFGQAYGLSECDYEDAESIVSKPLLVKEVLLSLATENLPCLAGEMLSKLVVSALNGFDGAFVTVSANQQSVGSAEGTKIGEGMRYIHEVVQVLERIKI